MKHNREAEDKLAAGRCALYLEHPFYGILSMRLLQQQTADVPTAAVSNTTLYYNPEYILEQPEELDASLWAHEIGHCMLDHIDRSEGYDKKRWNAAADYVVNGRLVLDGLPIGKDWLHDPQYDGMFVEQVYYMLPDSPPGDDGSWGAMDDMRPGEDTVMDGDAKLDWQMAAINAAEECEKKGTLPKSMERFIEKIKSNKVAWQERLRRFATEHSKNDYSWARLNRRMLPHGLCFPSLFSESVGTISVAIDTSGSITQHILDVFGAEITAIKQQVMPKQLINIYCDAAVNKVAEFGEFDEPTYELCGGGGTDFRPPFEYIAEKGLKPACLIYLTDGYGEFPSEPPPYPVMWVMTTEVVAPLGETIRIEL